MARLVLLLHFCWLFGGGGFGRGFTGSTLFDMDPREAAIESLLPLLEPWLEPLSLLLMRERVWDAMLRADMNARYWKLYETRVTWIEKLTRILVILSSIVSLVAWALKDDYLPAATAVSAIAAFLVVVIAPALGLDGYSAKVLAIKQAWIALRLDYEDLWADIDECDSSSWKRRWKTIQKQDLELEQGGTWTPVSKKLVTMAQADTEALFVPTLCEASES